MLEFSRVFKQAFGQVDALNANFSLLRIGFFQKDLAHQVGSRSTAEAPRGAGVEAEEDRMGNEVGNEENKIFFTRKI